MHVVALHVHTNTAEQTWPNLHAASGTQRTYSNVSTSQSVMPVSPLCNVSSFVPHVLLVNPAPVVLVSRFCACFGGHFCHAAQGAY